jgi:hypothetical protein
MEPAPGLDFVEDQCDFDPIQPISSESRLMAGGSWAFSDGDAFIVKYHVK